MQLFLFLSAVIGLSGLIGYVIEVSAGRVKRYTRWTELTGDQWVMTVQMLQFIVVMLIALIVRSFS